MKKLMVLFLVLCLLTGSAIPITAKAESGFNISAASSSGYECNPSENGEYTIVESGWVIPFETAYSLPDIASVLFNDIYVDADGTSCLRTWIQYLGSEAIDFESVSFVIGNSEYTFKSTYSDEGQYNGNPYQDFLIIYGLQNESYLAALEEAFSAFSFDDFERLTIPMILHGTEDRYVELSGTAIWDLLSLYDAMKKYRGDFDEFYESEMSVVLCEDVISQNYQKVNISAKLGKTLLLGSWEQDNNTLNGTEPIEWIVLKVDGNKALLLSKYVLDYRAYNEEKSDVTWQTCTLRSWLNGPFYQTAFSGIEKTIVLETSISNSRPEQPKKEKWEGKPGNSTKDLVFLLSYNEIATKHSSHIKATGTEYANMLGASEWFNEYDGWWTRSTGAKQTEATYILDTNEAKSSSVASKDGIRPAIWITIEDTYWDSFPSQRYNEAQKLFKSGDYLGACNLADVLGSYNDSFALSAESRLKYAEEAMNKGNFEEAIVRINAYYHFIVQKWNPEDEDYTHFLSTCYYAWASECMSSKDYAKAIEIYSELGLYKDSMDKLLECFDKTHTQYSWLTKKTGSVVNAGTKDYKESKPIGSEDPHFGWTLGRFLISGYTEQNSNSTGPVFVKTPGDSMVLWFDLNQDIDCLNGNNDLTIADDTDGSDQLFGINPSDIGMGRGALLIRHTDYRNSDSDPIVYTDYLAASETGVANTRVEIKEEGIYEVSLNYEVHDANLKHILNRTNNYKILFSFTVKNGSGMFYMFDLDTGAELEDYSRTAEGFRIDLDGSHSLKVDVTRYAINTTATGLDVRSTGSASNGDEYSRTGYYEITVTNTETGSLLTKHIFVGSRGDLAEYQDMDESLAKFG